MIGICFSEIKDEGRQIMEPEQKLTDREYIDLIQPYTNCMRNMIARLKTLAADYEDSYHAKPIHHIQDRIKAKDSIEAKLRRKSLEVSVDAAKNYLCDIAGIRVICYFECDIYHIVSVLKKQMDLEIVKETDYIANPKENGYRSYHVVFAVPIYHVEGMEYFPVEVQLRTMAMDLWASMEHRICYKADLDQEELSSRKDAFRSYAGQLRQMEEHILEFSDTPLKLLNSKKQFLDK